MTPDDSKPRRILIGFVTLLTVLGVIFLVMYRTRMQKSPNSIVQLAWTASLPEEEVLLYRLYEVVAKTPTSPPRWQNIGQVTGTQIAATGLPTSLHVYAITAVNALRESARSSVLFVRF